MKNFTEIKTLLTDAKTLERFHTEYQEIYASDRNCDKKGYGFGYDDRFRTFNITTGFDSKKGYYGNSGCSSILSVYGKDAVQKAFVKAMNQHQEELFKTAAKILRENALSLKQQAEAELNAAQAVLNEINEIQNS